MRSDLPLAQEGRPTRRGILRAGLMSTLGLDLIGLIRARAEGTALPEVRGGSLPPIRACIAIFYYGGPSQLDTFDPKPDAPAEIRGEFRPIATSVPGIQVSEHLPMTARVMHKVALIRSMHHNNHLHDPASIETFTGRLPPQGDFELFSPVPQQFPSWGGTVSYMLRGRDLPVTHAALPFVFHNVVETPCQGGGFLGSAFDPFRVDVDPGSHAYRADMLARPEGLGAARQDSRRELLEAIDGGGLSPHATRMRQHYEKAYRLLGLRAIARGARHRRRRPAAARPLRDRPKARGLPAPAMGPSTGTPATCAVGTCCWRAGWSRRASRS